MSQTPRVLLVDFNNFARYPSLPVGYLAAILRRDHFDVAVFAPLMIGVKGTQREQRMGKNSLLRSLLNYQVASSGMRWLRKLRNRLALWRISQINRSHGIILTSLKARLEEHQSDVVLISTYLMYHPLCAEVCAHCAALNIPVVIGGPYFSQIEVNRHWLQIRGLSALVTGELELQAPQIVRLLMDGQPVDQVPGVMTAEPAESGVLARTRGTLARPARNLDEVPFPDFSDFPWDRYPVTIVPLITGRGCGWGACGFCSDVTSSAGRTFRSRSAENVMAEISQQYQRYGAKHFVFTDLKLNSNLTLWRHLLDNIQEAAPGARWIASVHVGSEADNGLSPADLQKAAASGCVRLTTGLESGSQRMLDAMKKGTNLQGVSAFLNAAANAGISCRTTMISGYPGEQAADLYESAQFLQKHDGQIERIALNRLALIIGTPLERVIRREPERYAHFRTLGEEPIMAQVEHHYDNTGSRAYRRAMRALIGEVVRINSRPLRATAMDFDGVM